MLDLFHLFQFIVRMVQITQKIVQDPMAVKKIFP